MMKKTLLRLLALMTAVFMLIPAMAEEEEPQPWELLYRKPIAAGLHTVVVMADGTVATVGYARDGVADVAEWTEVIAVAAGNEHTVGLRADGTVLATGYNPDGRCDVAEWTEIAAIAAGPTHTVGVRADGTVVAVGGSESGQCDVAEWTDVVAVAAGAAHTLGLRADGTVLAAGDNAAHQCDVAEWADVIAVAACAQHSVGLRADGTVLLAGTLDDDAAACREWSGIVDIAACEGGVVGLKADGTVLLCGRDEYGLSAVTGWTEIIMITAGERHIVGLKADGAVVAAGFNIYGQCDLPGWSLSASEASTPYVVMPELLPIWERVPGYEMPVQTAEVAKGVRLKFVGILNIPALNLKLPVQSTWSYDNLVYTPCRYAGSCYYDGYVIIAHSYESHFAGIRNLPVGTTISFTDMDGNVFRYSVVAVETLNNDQVEELISTDYAMSLMTCKTGGVQRIVVRCERK